jgi:hypothetical protein
MVPVPLYPKKSFQVSINCEDTCRISEKEGKTGRKSETKGISWETKWEKMRETKKIRGDITQGSIYCSKIHTAPPPQDIFPILAVCKYLLPMHNFAFILPLIHMFCLLILIFIFPIYFNFLPFSLHNLLPFYHPFYERWAFFYSSNR